MIRSTGILYFPSITLWLPNLETDRKPEEDDPGLPKKMERKILGISLHDRIPNATIRALANSADAVQRATTLKWKWGGHVARLQSCKWTQLETIWDQRIGQQHRGRPATRRSGEFKTISGVPWSRTARSREDWEKIIAVNI